MDSNQWTTQEINGGLRPMGDQIATSSACSRQQPAGVAERKARPQKDQALNCPRCHSTNTKFCYYNNYSLTQPRYFCKTCRRYWTEGGTLRNVPVGGGSRKNKRSTTTTTTTTASSHKLPDLNPPNISPEFASRNPNKIMNGVQDLNLGFPGSQHLYHFELPKIIDNSSHNQLKSSSSSATPTPFAALELLRTGLASRGMNSNFITTSGSMAPDLNAIYTNTSGFSFQELKPAAGAVSFSVDGLGSSRYVLDPRGGIQENGGRLMFPLGAMKQAAPAPSSTEVDQNNRGQLSNSNGFWNGMLGGGGSW